MKVLDKYTSVLISKQEYEYLKTKLSKTKTPLAVYLRAKILTFLSEMEGKNVSN